MSGGGGGCQDSTFGTGNRKVTEQPRIRGCFPTGLREFSPKIQTGPRTHQAPYSVANKAISSGVKRLSYC
jgi:hypothetical protein